MKNKYAKIALKICRVAFATALWVFIWWIAATRYGKPLLFPSPKEVFPTLWAMLQTPEFYKITATSLKNIFIGFISAIGIGTVLAICTSYIPLLRDIVSPFMTVVKATPVASFVVLVWILIGAEKIPALITALIVLPIVWTNLDVGFHSVDRQLREVTKVYRFSPFKTLRTLILPTVAPYWISACRTALGLAWKAGVAAEIIAMPPDTIGKMIGEAKIYILTEEVFAWTLTIILLSILIEFVFSALLNQLLKKMSHTGGVSHADI